MEVRELVQFILGQWLPTRIAKWYSGEVLSTTQLPECRRARHCHILKAFVLLVTSKA